MKLLTAVHLKWFVSSR